jgi:hypothetical protein
MLVQRLGINRVFVGKKAQSLMDLRILDDSPDKAKLSVDVSENHYRPEQCNYSQL